MLRLFVFNMHVCHICSSWCLCWSLPLLPFLNRWPAAGYSRLQASPCCLRLDRQQPHTNCESATCVLRCCELRRKVEGLDEQGFKTATDSCQGKTWEVEGPKTEETAGGKSVACFQQRSARQTLSVQFTGIEVVSWDHQKRPSVTVGLWSCWLRTSSCPKSSSAISKITKKNGSTAEKK